MPLVPTNELALLTLALVKRDLDGLSYLRSSQAPRTRYVQEPLFVSDMATYYFKLQCGNIFLTRFSGVPGRLG